MSKPEYDHLLTLESWSLLEKLNSTGIDKISEGEWKFLKMGLSFDEVTILSEGVLDIYPEVINLMSPLFQEIVKIKTKIKWNLEIQNDILFAGLAKHSDKAAITIKAFDFFSWNPKVPDNVPFIEYGIPIKWSLEVKEDDIYLTDDEDVL